MTDDDVTQLQLAVEARDLELMRKLIADETAQDLEALQIFGNYTLLMYVCRQGTPEMVRLLIELGVGVHELEWSDNNEIKSTLSNPHHAAEILTLILSILPDDLAHDMLTSDWNNDVDSQEASETPLELAKALTDPSCLKLLEEAIATLSS